MKKHCSLLNTSLRLNFGVGYLRLVNMMPAVWSSNKLRADEAIIKSARMSTNQSLKTEEQDINLINYLIKHEHSSPFEMVNFTFLVRVPLFVKNHVIRHRDYFYDVDNLDHLIDVDEKNNWETDSFYRPYFWRLPDNVNQQSSAGYILLDNETGNRILDFYQEYKNIQNSFPPDIYKSMMPQSAFVNFLWTTNLRSLFNFIKLRLHKDSQLETQFLALKIREVVQHTNPTSLEAFQKKNNINSDDYPLIIKNSSELNVSPESKDV